MAAAAAAAANRLLKPHRDFHSLHCLWNKRSIKHSAPDPFAFPQPKLSSRFTHSRFRKPKDLEFPSRASSSSHKFGLIGWYLTQVKTRPIATKSITAAFIYTAADISSQMIVGEASVQYDVMRSVRMAGYGLLILGPTIHYWYTYMSRVFPKRDIASTLKKMALGQTFYGPAMTVIFFSANAALQGESGSEIIARLKRDLIPTFINGIMYWPICDFVTFKFIPVHLQPLVTNSFSYLWTVYMTYMASLEKVGSS